MGLLNLPLPTLGEPAVTEDADVLSSLTQLQDWANGNVDAANIAAGAVGVDELAFPVLKLAISADRKVAFGADSLTGVGATSQTKSVSHGLGVVPVVVLVGAQLGGYVGAVTAPPTSSAFTASLTQVEGLTFSHTVPFYWLAIG